MELRTFAQSDRCAAISLDSHGCAKRTQSGMPNPVRLISSDHNLRHKNAEDKSAHVVGFLKFSSTPEQLDTCACS